MKLKSIIIISGRISSGKSTFAILIAKQFGFPIASFGGYLTYYCKKNNLKTDRETLQNVGERFIQTNPQLFLENVITYFIGDSESIIIEGVRHKIIFDELLQLSENAFPIFIDADQQTRYERYINRNKVSDIIVSFKQFLVIDNHPVEMEIESLKSRCSLIIDTVNQPINITMESIKDILNKKLR